MLAGLMANQSDVAVDWWKDDVAAIIAIYHKRLAEFTETTTKTLSGVRTAVQGWRQAKLLSSGGAGGPPPSFWS